MKVKEEIAKIELVKAARLGQKIFNGVCDDAESVGNGLMALTFALSMAAVTSPQPVPVDHLHELLDLIHRMVSDADDSVFDGAEQYGMQ